MDNSPHPDAGGAGGDNDLWVNGKEVAQFDFPQALAHLRDPSR